MTAARRRLDAELVRRGLAPSREAAQRVIDSGLVTVAAAPADKPSRMVAAAEPIELLAPLALREPRRRQARRCARSIRHRRGGADRARRGSIDRRVHRLPPQSGARACLRRSRRRARAARPASPRAHPRVSSTRTAQRPHAPPGRSAPSTSSSPTSPSSHWGPCSTRCRSAPWLALERHPISPSCS